MNHYYYHPEEDEMILNEVMNHQTKKEAFASAAQKSGRTPAAICTRWYTVIKDKPSTMLTIHGIKVTYDDNITTTNNDNDSLFKTKVKQIINNFINKLFK